MADLFNTMHMEFTGKFTHSELEFAARLKNIKAFIFDWDGVFNNSFKQGQNGSGFSEVDSMGINLLRFSHYINAGQMAATAIISGENNESARFFAEREHLNYNFSKIPHKIMALEHVCAEQGLKPEEVCYFFDDVLDLSIAKVCGLRILIDKPAIHFFKQYCIENDLVDYATANDGAHHGIRESCEMIMTISKTFDKVLQERTTYSTTYQDYLGKRQSIETTVLTLDKSKNKFIKP